MVSSARTWKDQGPKGAGNGFRTSDGFGMVSEIRAGFCHSRLVRQEGQRLEREAADKMARHRPVRVWPPNELSLSKSVTAMSL